MKLNRKGYMLVEIIVSFVLAFTIAIYLLNLVVKFKDTSEEIYHSTNYSRDRNLITRNIMNDLENITINNFSLTGNKLTLNVIKTNDDGTTSDEIRVLEINNHTIQYGKYNSSFEKADVSYYTKQLDQSLIIENITPCDGNINDDLTNGYFCIKIPISAMYDDNNYDIKLFSTNVINPTTPH